MVFARRATVKLSEISPYIDSQVLTRRPSPRYKQFPAGKTNSLVDEMSGNLENIVDDWIKVDWNDVDEATKKRFSDAITELLDIVNNEDI